MTTTPNDLVALHKVAKRLHQETSKLADMSATGDFPTVWDLGHHRRSLFVSQAAVDQWLAGRTEMVLHAERKARTDLVLELSREASQSRLELHSPDDSTASPLHESYDD